MKNGMAERQLVFQAMMSKKESIGLLVQRAGYLVNISPAFCL